MRPDRTNYYLNIAEAVSGRGTCIRRVYGAVIVKDDVVVSTGYAGAPRGCKNCIDIGVCKRQALNIPRGERYELCRSVHAEMNAIISASRNDMIESVMYITGREVESGEYTEGAEPCALCKRLIINAGIKLVITRIDKDKYKVFDAMEWVEEEDQHFDKLGY